MKAIIRAFDNGGKTFDQYTIVIFQKTKKDIQHVDVFGMSLEPRHPQGFNQWLGTISELPLVVDALAGKNTELGKEIELLDLPLTVRLGIGDRLKAN